VKRSIAQARTLTALRQLDEEHKGLPPSFPFEADLIEKEAVVTLSAVVVIAACLCGACLCAADLSEAMVTDEQLAKARNLEGATPPDATVHAKELPPTNSRPKRSATAWPI
jgi:uncharacterized protein YjbI with pentapeptide repeats